MPGRSERLDLLDIRRERPGSGMEVSTPAFAPPPLSKPGSHSKTNGHDSRFFVLRAPLLPIEAWLRLSDDLESRAAFVTGGDLDAAGGRDRALLASRLQSAFQDPVVREAIALASPDLFDTLEGRVTQSPERIERAWSGFLRYFARMTSRPTPFGTFAASSVGSVGEQTRLSVSDPSRWTRHTRLDMGYVHDLAGHWIQTAGPDSAVVLEPNTSLTACADRYNYCEARSEAGHLSYHLVAADATAYLRATLRRAEGGATARALAEGLVADDPEVTPEEAAAYVQSLVENQLLVSHLVPPLTSPEPARGLAESLRVEGAPAATVLAESLDHLRALDAAGLGRAPEEYDRLRERLGALPVEPARERMVQVDCFRSEDRPTVGREIVREALSGLDALWHLFGRETQSAMTTFRNRFHERYGERELPLLEALASENGIGFGPEAPEEPLVQGLALGFGPERTSWTGWDAFLLEKLETCWSAGDTELELSEQDCRSRHDDSPPFPLPTAFSLIASLTAGSEEALRRGQFRLWLRGLSGPSGAKFLGRFCHVDERLAAATREHLRLEEALQPEAVFAEIVHVPQGRVANVLARPPLRDYEIPFLGRSGMPPDHQIPPSDLRIALREGRFRLRSERLGREIIPRLSTAHNFSSTFNIGLYRFLCMLQWQGTATGIGWQWGPLGNCRFLPRVRHGRTVLSAATWTITRSELDALSSDRPSDRFARVQRLRDARGLPRHCVLTEGDQELLLDLDNPMCADLLGHAGRGVLGIRLAEPWPSISPEELPSVGAQGHFVHELILPLVQSEPPAPTAAALETDSSPAALSSRRFLPGSEWMTVKLYTNEVSADRLLNGTLRELVEAWTARRWIDRWFFVRYADPDFHLRLRFHGRPETLHGELFGEFRQALEGEVRTGRCRTLQLDTYEREIERYGGLRSIGVVEELFHRDSTTVLALLGVLAEQGPDWRWKAGLAGVHALLRDAEIPPARRLLLVERLKEGFAREFRLDGAARSRIGDRFRRERGGIEQILRDARDEGPLREIGAILDARSRAAAAPFRLLRELQDRDLLHGGLERVLESLIHMHFNRLFRTAQREQEAVLYHFLAQAYRAQRARARAERGAA